MVVSPVMLGKIWRVYVKSSTGFSSSSTGEKKY